MNCDDNEMFHIAILCSIIGIIGIYYNAIMCALGKRK